MKLENKQGTSNHVSEVEDRPNRKQRMIKLITLGCAVAIGILAFIIFIFKPKKEDSEYTYVTYNQNSTTYTLYKVKEEDKIVFFRADGKVTILDEENVVDSSSSLTSEVVALLTEDQKLYVMTVDGYQLADEKVQSVLVSQDGTAIAYVKDVTKEVGDLYRYDVTDNSSVVISSDVSIRDYVISPDGESIAFCMGTKGEPKQELYVSIDLIEPKLIGLNQIPNAISNQGTYLYVTQEDGFYLISKEKSIQLSDGFQQEEHYTFNSEYTQVLYHKDGKTYLCEEGKITKISDGIIIRTYLPPDALQFHSLLGASSFQNQMVLQSDGYYYINDDYEMIYLCENTGKSQVSNNGESLLIMEDDELYLVTMEGKNVTQKQIGENLNIKQFKATLNFSHIYYVNYQDELYSITEDGVEKKLADHVAEYDFLFNRYDGYLYYMVDAVNQYGQGQIYYSIDGEAGTKVENISDASIGDVFGSTMSVHRIDAKQTDLYYIFKGEATLILEQASHW